MKYSKIYALLNERARQVAGFHISDHSYWRSTVQNWLTRNQPLWIVVEDPSINRRIWIGHERGQFSLSTARLDLGINSRAYHNSHCYWRPHSQGELVEQLQKIFALEQEEAG